MSKELEEIKGIVAIHFGALGFLNPCENERILKDRNKVLNALNRLEAIENANPSDVLGCLDSMYARLPQWDLCRNLDQYNIIKQALLKAQEPKHYLKWEDLEFGKTTHKLKAKMNDSLYRIEWYIDGLGSKVVCIDKYITNDYLIHSACIKDYNKQFFNDLHLEVEE